jgi:transposase-like protein
MNLTDIAGNFHDADSARAFLEAKRWQDGTICPHCGLLGESYRLEAKPDSKHPIRKGVWKCKGCRKQFTVTVDTIFADSHIPLHKWLMAIHLLCASKKGMSSHQLHRMLGVTYKSAWFMTHRIRYAMKQEPLKRKMSGTVEMDETYVGGKRKRIGRRGRPNVESHKSPVVALVQRNGRVISRHVERVSSLNLKEILFENVRKDAHVMTDDFSAYAFVKSRYPNHSVINHSKESYARRDGKSKIHVNTAEGFFSLLKRGIMGSFHHVSKQHLHRYLNEFDFRYNARGISDGERTLLAIKGVTGKRLTYRDARKRAITS